MSAQTPISAATPAVDEARDCSTGAHDATTIVPSRPLSPSVHQGDKPALPSVEARSEHADRQVSEDRSARESAQTVALAVAIVGLLLSVLLAIAPVIVAVLIVGAIVGVLAAPLVRGAATWLVRYLR